MKIYWELKGEGTLHEHPNRAQTNRISIRIASIFNCTLIMMPSMRELQAMVSHYNLLEVYLQK